jgi:hypothetical protein
VAELREELGDGPVPHPPGDALFPPDGCDSVETSASSSTTTTSIGSAQGLAAMRWLLAVCTKHDRVGCDLERSI